MAATDEPDETRLAGRVPRRPLDEPPPDEPDDPADDDEELDTVTRLLGFLRNSD